MTCDNQTEFTKTIQDSGPRCRSERIFFIGAKSSDLNSFSFKGKTGDGYAPGVKNICGGDYIEFRVCLDCGKIQGKFPVDDPESDRWDDDDEENA